MSTAIKTLIVDDEESGRRAVQQLISLTGVNLELVDMVDTVDAARQSILDHSPQLVFLDIQLQDQVGFELLQSDIVSTFEVIFITAHDAYALEAFNENALSYLLKPVEPSEFKKAVLRAIDFIQSRQSEGLNGNRYTSLLHDVLKNKMPVSNGHEVEYLDLDEIGYIEAAGSYSVIHLMDSTHRTVSKNLKQLENLLPASPFIRPHRSFLVNVNVIRKWNRSDGGSLVLTNNTSIPVSREGKELLGQLLR